MYKNRFTGHVISEADYYKLPWTKRQEFERVYNEEVSHRYSEESDDFLIGAAIGAVIGMNSFFGDDSPSIDSTPDTNFDFGGGDFGGGGAGGEF